MRKLGKLTSVVLLAAAVAAAVVGVRSIPDFKRYQKIRAM